MQAVVMGFLVGLE